MADDDILTWVQDRVIAYFAKRFGYPPKTFKWDTDVRKAFNFNASAWAELADHLNRLDWMIQIHVLLAQREMAKIKTIGDLTSAISDKHRKQSTFAVRLTTSGNLPTLPVRAAARKKRH